MKRLLCFLAAGFALSACSFVEVNYQGDTNPDGPADPEFSVSGLPGSKVNSNITFTLSVSSKSDGRIDFKSSDPELAFISLSAKREYRVSVKEPQKDTEVKITFVQEPWDNYPETVYEVPFTVKADSDDVPTTIPIDPHADLDGVKVAFSESHKHVTNPERGIYRSVNFMSASATPLKASEVIAQRAAGYSLYYTGFYLTEFMDGDISQEYLDMFQACMDALREGGSKCMLRFAYKTAMSDKEDMEPEIPILLRHVEQLKPYLQKNEDVIFVFQAGFVGPWGEWHSSTHFGSSFELRRQLCDVLLDAVPVSRQIQLRTPQFKMRMYDLSPSDTITAATAHDGSAISRLAGHNDCFGASINDYGTFDNEWHDREFWKSDTRYTIMGGETCNVSEYCTCKATLKDMVDYHWTLLNKDYHSDVINRWKTSDCFGEIDARLGYRLVMQDLFYSEAPKAGKPCKVTLRLYNTGFAAPMNPRDAILVWETPDGTMEETPLGSDPRTWHPGYHVVSATFTPSTDKGALYLKLSDPLLSARPEYSIALANEDVFDQQTGLNKLFEIK